MAIVEDTETLSDKKPKRSRKDKSLTGNTEADHAKSKKRKHDKLTPDSVQDGKYSATTEEPTSKKKKKTDKIKHTEEVRSGTGILEGAEPKKRSHRKKRKSNEEKSVEDPLDQPEKKHKKRRREDVPTDPESIKDKKKTLDITTVESVSTGSSSSHKPSKTPSAAEVEAFLAKHSITIHASRNGGTVTPILSFDQLDVSLGLKQAFAGFEEPTPIQACSWPPALKGQDVVGIAETGSGKTLAFGIPALSQLISTSNMSKNTGVRVLVMSPTRELAIQTHETLLALGKSFGITSVAVFGGVDKGGQIKALKDKKVRIVVGTPGRIMDLVNDGVCNLSCVTYLVLDEADRMLDKGFENDIRTIIGYTRQGEDRQTLMFSATWPEAVRKLASTFQRDPVRVTVGSDDLTANSRVEQVVEVFDDIRSKDSRLLGHLRNLMPKTSKQPSLDDARVLVFVLYKKEATRVEALLHHQNYSVAGLHGDLSQSARMEALQSFKAGDIRVLVATDVAARGLDIPNVAVVLNYSFPLTIEDYIHRIGRTGRGGKNGKSLTFFTGENHERALAGELARVLRESGFDIEPLKKFPMTIKKKSHSVYGAFYREDVPIPSGPTKIKF